MVVSSQEDAAVFFALPPGILSFRPTISLPPGRGSQAWTPVRRSSLCGFPGLYSSFCLLLRFHGASFFSFFFSVCGSCVLLGFCLVLLYEVLVVQTTCLLQFFFRFEVLFHFVFILFFFVGFQCCFTGYWCMDYYYLLLFFVFRFLFRFVFILLFQFCFASFRFVLCTQGCFKCCFARYWNRLLTIVFLCDCRFSTSRIILFSFGSVLLNFVSFFSMFSFLFSFLFVFFQVQI